MLGGPKGVNGAEAFIYFFFFIRNLFSSLSFRPCDGSWWNISHMTKSGRFYSITFTVDYSQIFSDKFTCSLMSYTHSSCPAHLSKPITYIKVHNTTKYGRMTYNWGCLQGYGSREINIYFHELLFRALPKLLGSKKKEKLLKSICDHWVQCYRRFKNGEYFC